jgi:hypothetical protein
MAAAANFRLVLPVTGAPRLGAGFDRKVLERSGAKFLREDQPEEWFQATAAFIEVKTAKDGHAFEKDVGLPALPNDQTTWNGSWLPMTRRETASSWTQCP